MPSFEDSTTWRRQVSAEMGAFWEHDLQLRERVGAKIITEGGQKGKTILMQDIPYQVLGAGALELLEKEDSESE